MRSAPVKKDSNSSATDGPNLGLASLVELLAEVGRRVHVRFGRLEVVFHDGTPSPKLVVEHRIQRVLGDE